VLLEGRRVLLLCSNNYLDLAADPRVREASAQAALALGAGAGASRLVAGTMDIHSELEGRLAGFAGSESCLLFGSGYLANVGVLGALAGPGDQIFSDQLNHASIIDGCRLSRARVSVYRHRDPDHLERLLREETGVRRRPAASPVRAASGRRVIVTESVFSMDGDLAPLRDIVGLAREHGALTVVDEAHALGALGPGGRGAVAAAGLEGQVDVLVGTLGKALGSYGAFVCTGAEIVDYLVNSARSLIFSTAPPPPAAAGALAALTIIERDPRLADRLRARARALREGLAAEGFPVRAGDMHIIPLVLGSEERAMSLSQAALERGLFAQGIRPPSVPPGTSRLRLTVSAGHDPGELRQAARTLADAAREVGIEPGEVTDSAGFGLDQSRRSPAPG
jgi:glycine C-acetyltransferase/8-amino-7-oxononanoate synthase